MAFSVGVDLRFNMGITANI